MQAGLCNVKCCVDEIARLSKGYRVYAHRRIPVLRRADGIGALSTCSDCPVVARQDMTRLSYMGASLSLVSGVYAIRQPAPILSYGFRQAIAPVEVGAHALLDESCNVPPHKSTSSRHGASPGLSKSVETMHLERGLLRPSPARQKRSSSSVLNLISTSPSSLAQSCVSANQFPLGKDSSSASLHLQDGTSDCQDQLDLACVNMLGRMAQSLEILGSLQQPPEWSLLCKSGRRSVQASPFVSTVLCEHCQCV